MAKDDRIVIDVDDPAFRGKRLRDLVHVVGGWQVRADIEELADANFVSKEPDRAAQEITVLPGGGCRTGFDFKNFTGGHPVSKEIVLASEQHIEGYSKLLCINSQACPQPAVPRPG